MGAKAVVIDQEGIVTLDGRQHFQVAVDAMGGKHFADFFLLVRRPQEVGFHADDFD